MPARGKGRGAKRISQRNANAAANDPPAKKMRDAAQKTPQETKHVETTPDAPGKAPPTALASGAPHAAGRPDQGSSSDSAPGTSGQSASGKDGAATSEWSKGTSSNDNEWDHKPPKSIETPDHLAIICPPATQQLIWDGIYVNLACFIPKEEGEELTTRLEWTDGTLKQHTTPRQIRTIFDWTSAFIRFMEVYLQYHPGKALEMLRYMDIVRLAYTKWGGMGWRAYDEQQSERGGQQPVQG
jgi:hypothetical protein